MQKLTINIGTDGRPIGTYTARDKGDYAEIKGTAPATNLAVLQTVIDNRVIVQLEKTPRIYDDYDLVMETQQAGNRMELGVLLPTVVFTLHFLRRERYKFEAINDDGRAHMRTMINRWTDIRELYQNAQIDKLEKENS